MPEAIRTGIHAYKTAEGHHSVSVAASTTEDEDIELSNGMQEEEVLVQNHLSINKSRAAERRQGPAETAPPRSQGAKRFKIPAESQYASMSNKLLLELATQRCEQEESVVLSLGMTRVSKCAGKEELFNWLSAFDIGKGRMQ